MSEETVTATAPETLTLTPPEPVPAVAPEKAAGLVPLSAAICNAIVAAGGKRPRRLPLAAEGWEMAA